MNKADPKKTFLETWLRRTRRELASSGKISEIAFILSKDGEAPQHEWCAKLRRILDQEEQPDFELLTRIDTILSRPTPTNDTSSGQADLW